MRLFTYRLLFFAEIEDLPASVQEQLFDELLDKDVQQQLEMEPAVINWSVEITVQLGSRLHALWNRSVTNRWPLFF